MPDMPHCGTVAKNNGWDTAGLILGVASILLLAGALIWAAPVLVVLAVAVSVVSTVIACVADTTSLTPGLGRYGGVRVVSE